MNNPNEAMKTNQNVNLREKLENLKNNACEIAGTSLAIKQKITGMEVRKETKDSRECAENAYGMLEEIKLMLEFALETLKKLDCEV